MPVSTRSSSRRRSSTKQQRSGSTKKSSSRKTRRSSNGKSAPRKRKTSTKRAVGSPRTPSRTSSRRGHRKSVSTEVPATSLASPEETASQMTHLRSRRAEGGGQGEGDGGFRLNNMFRANADFVEKPRQVLIWSVVFVPLIVWAFRRFSDEEDGTARLHANVQAILIVVCSVFCVYVGLNMRDTVMTRPHPMYWRVWHGLGVVYFMALLAVLVLDLKDAKMLTSAVVQVVPDKAAQDDVWNMKDCTITRKTLWRQISSVWFLSHLVGWFCKMFLFRSFQYMLPMSFCFELVELTLQFLIPDFQECWWDSLFIDHLGANLIGMLVGWWVLKYFNRKEFHWASVAKTQSMSHLALSRLTPRSMRFYHWRPFVSFQRYLNAAIPFIVTQILETTLFLFMFLLGIVAGGPFVVFRLALALMIGLQALNEFYAYTNTPPSAYKRIGPNIWLILGIASVETLICIKFGMEHFKGVVVPVSIYGPWLAFLVVHGLWLVIYFNRKRLFPLRDKADLAHELAEVADDEDLSDYEDREVPEGSGHFHRLMLSANVPPPQVSVDEDEVTPRVRTILNAMLLLSFMPLLLLCRGWVWEW